MWKHVFKITFVVGLLDILAAFIQAYVTNKVTPGIVLKYIASGVFAEKAFEGSFEMILAGLIFHFIIAFACTGIFFYLYPKLKLLHSNILLNSFIIAVVTWAITTQIIMPLSNVNAPLFDFANTLTTIAILFACVGFPIAYYAEKLRKQMVTQDIDRNSW